MENTTNGSQEGRTRESWGSRFGFIMATAGFAIGLGNIWRFPYMVGMNGGGAFLLIYVGVILLICVPLFLAEISLGRKTQSNPILGMRKATKKGSPWVLIGWFGSIAAFLIMTYYLMIMGWVFAYLFKSASGAFTGGITTEEISVIYTGLISNPKAVLFYTAMPTIILGLIVTKGLKDGVEKACKIMMPVLFISLIVLAIRSMTLPGAMEGIKWYLTPDFSKITGATFLAALGQAFFSVGIGMAAAFTYGSYLGKDSNLAGDGLTVVIFDKLIAIVAGFVMFPAMFAFNMEPAAGPGLIFLTMPKLFAQIPGGYIFGTVFFALLVLASLSTGVGFVETIASSITEMTKIDRKKSVWLTVTGMFVVGIPTVLSQGPWKNVSIMGKDIFDFVDYLSGNILLVVGALLLSLYTAYVWKFENYMEETNVGSGRFKVAKWWKPLVNALIPIAVAIILFRGIF